MGKKKKKKVSLSQPENSVSYCTELENSWTQKLKMLTQLAWLASFFPSFALWCSDCFTGSQTRIPPGSRGYFRTSAQRYLIEPLSGGDEGDHAVTTVHDGNLTPAVCGVTNTSWEDDVEPPTSRSRSRSGVGGTPLRLGLAVGG